MAIVYYPKGQFIIKRDTADTTTVVSTNQIGRPEQRVLANDFGTILVVPVQNFTSSFAVTSSYLSPLTSSAAPSDAVNIKFWIDVSINGVIYKMPLYQ